MALPTIEVSDRNIVLLSGFENAIVSAAQKSKATPRVIIRDEEDLKRSVRRHRDAVAFGYVAGKWIVAA